MVMLGGGTDILGAVVVPVAVTVRGRYWRGVATPHRARVLLSGINPTSSAIPAFLSRRPYQRPCPPRRTPAARTRLTRVGPAVQPGNSSRPRHVAAPVDHEQHRVDGIVALWVARQVSTTMKSAWAARLWSPDVATWSPYCSSPPAAPPARPVRKVVPAGGSGPWTAASTDLQGRRPGAPRCRHARKRSARSPVLHPARPDRPACSLSRPGGAPLLAVSDCPGHEGLNEPGPGGWIRAGVEIRRSAMSRPRRTWSATAPSSRHRRERATYSA